MRSSLVAEAIMRIGDEYPPQFVGISTHPPLIDSTRFWKLP
jgi:hypothetical protein